MIHIALDIDGTLGYRNRQQYLKTCNEALKLALAEEHVQKMSLSTFYALPEVQAYRERVGEAHYTKALAWIDFHPDVLQAMHPLEGAREGVQMLARIGHVGYYTARYSAQSEERSTAMAQATLQWLATHDFCNPTNAVFCDGLPGKLRQLAKVAGEQTPILLVDDQYNRLLQRFTDLDEETAQLLRRSLILVAYGARTVPESAPIQAIALPSWEREAVEQMLEQVAGVLPREQEVQAQSSKKRA